MSVTHICALPHFTVALLIMEGDVNFIIAIVSLPLGCQRLSTAAESMPSAPSSFLFGVALHVCISSPAIRTFILFPLISV